MYFLPEFQKKFNVELKRHIEKEFTLYKKQLGVFYKEYKDLWEYIKPLSKKGKRVRPYACYVAYTASGGKKLKEIMGLCIAIELLHVAFLVHDDIMDKGETRHGIQTAHRYFAEKSKEKVQDEQHYGESIALLLGDMLTQWSASLFTQEVQKFSKETASYLNKLYFDMMGETILGQGIDLLLTARDHVSEKEIDLKNFFKTSNYTFIKPFLLGSGVVVRNKNLENFYKKFGMHLGALFQIQDDMLDIMGDPKKINKSVFTDIKTGQHTFFTQYIFDNGLKKEKETLKKYFGKQRLSLKDEKELRNIFIKSGAILYGEQKVEHHFKKAHTLLKKEKRIHNKESLYALLHLVSKRSS